MKRRKTIRAGRLVYDIAYTVPRPNATKQERGRIREVTAEQIARTNCNTAQRKLELLMAANFEPGDLLISPTYRDDDLPGSVDITRRRLVRDGVIERKGDNGHKAVPGGGRPERA
ncbi:MAG: hypothetical protein MR935_07345 [Agathobaculum sp.]|uniref:hypothetical protein n=1 Tax=Agathobaculum sp. TaxID=2048138 RepID=UPI0025BA3C0D|nr:hypothetical protein [Agathobaculum sp.]MCI7125989.1 hypothetical protein [Agathobaculum sp.]